MKHHFMVNGMTCLTCVSTVKDLIKTNPKIASYIGTIDIKFIPGSPAELTIELTKRLGPNRIIEAITSNPKYHVIHTHTLDDHFPYYFEITPMPTDAGELPESSNMKAALKLIGESIETHLNVVSVNIDSDSSRAKIVTNAPIPDKIISFIKGLNYNAILLSNKKTYHYVIKGLTSSKQVKQIQECLERHETDVDTFQVKFSTNVISVTIVSDDSSEKIAEVKDRVIGLISTAVEDIVIEEIQSPIEQYDDFNMPKKYFSRFRLNLFIGIAFSILNLLGLIIPPVTLLGQAMGLFLGGITLGVMWTTGREFYQGAWNKFVRDRSSDMDTMIALGTGAAWIYSMSLVIFPVFFPLAALQYQFLAVNMILGIINFGRGVRATSLEKANKNVQSLAQVYVDWQNQLAKRRKIRSPINELEENDSNEEIEIIGYRDIKVGDFIKVFPDERFPVDGIILGDYETLVDQSAITGEALLCDKNKRDNKILSGTLNTKNTVEIRASCNGSEGTLTRLIEEVEEANKKSRSEDSRISRVVDKLAGVFVPTIIGLSAFSAMGWFIFGPAPQLAWMLKSAMSVLLCACPCALGLATPISTTISIYKLFHRGIIVRDVNALEYAAQIDTVIFDKTNTLTNLTSLVKDHILVEGKSEKEVLDLVAGLENAYLMAGSDHPIAKALVSENSSTHFLPCTELNNDSQGISGVIAKEKILVGSCAYLEKLSAEIGENFKAQEEKNDKKGLSSIFVAVEGRCVAVIGLSQQPRKDAAKEIEALQALGIQVMMLTGDNEAAAKAVAKQLNITKFYYNKDAAAKKEFIQAIQSDPKRVVLIIGDGVNDLPAIKKAKIGCALGSWTSASSGADIIFRNLNISTLVIIAKETMENIHQNIWGTGFYNLLSLSAAIGLWYPWFGFVLNPIIASLAMACSSIFVVFNSSRLAFVIDNAVDMHEKKSKPATIFEKLRQFCSLKTQVQTLRMFLSPHEEIEDSVKYYLTPDNNRVATPAESLSSSPTRFQPAVVKQETLEDRFGNEVIFSTPPPASLKNTNRRTSNQAMKNPSVIKNLFI